MFVDVCGVLRCACRDIDAIVAMTTIQALLVTICVKEVVLFKLDIENIFKRTADDIFNEKVGDIYKYKMDLSHNQKEAFKNFIHAKKSFSQNESLFDFPETTTTENSVVTFTPPSKNEGTPPPDMTLEDFRTKIKIQEVTSLLRGGHTQIPNFADDDDDPNMITRYFDLNISIPHSRRVYYHKLAKDDPIRMYNEKVRLTFIMIQFIYMTRRQMGYMTAMRHKYKRSYRYMMGYLFGLLRMVRQQQMILFKNLNYYYRNLNNAQLHLQFYYRIVTLSVDVNDILRYITKLNYEQNLKSNPRYYHDTMEYFDNESPKPEP